MISKSDHAKFLERKYEYYMNNTFTFKPDLLPSFTFPCDAQTALDLAKQIQEKLRTDWPGVGGVKDGVDLGLAARIIESYYGICKTGVYKTNE